MIKLLKEYVSLLLEAAKEKASKEKKPKDPNEIRGQMLSQLAEFAVAGGLGNTDFGDFEVDVEKLNSSFKAELVTLDRDKIETIKSIYDQCFVLAQRAYTKLQMPEGYAAPQNTGTTTAPIDIIYNVKVPGQDEPVENEIHVKLNDSARLIGLQGGDIAMTPDVLAGPIDEEWTAAPLYRYYRNQFAKNLLQMEEEPRRKSAYQILYKAGMHEQIFADKGVRRSFLDYLASKGLPDLILEEVKEFFERALSRKIYFFKYSTRPDPAKYDRFNTVSLDVTVLKADPTLFEIVENYDLGLGDDADLTPVQAAQMQHATTTRPYTITYNGKPVFVIEARSGSHPMQLKLFSADPKKVSMEDVYDEYTIKI